MKKKLISLLLAAVTLSTLLVAGCSGGRSISTLADRNFFRGEQFMKSAVDKYYERDIDLVNLYYSYPDCEKNEDYLASIWHFNSLQEAAVYYQQLAPDSDYANELVDDLYDTLQYYVEERSNDDYIVYGMYIAQEPGKNNEGENLFDDNSCIVRNIIHQYRNTGEETLLSSAQNTMDYVLDTGWDRKINTDTGEEFGGNPQGPAGTGMDYKPICANEINLTNLLQFSELADDEEEKDFYLDWAKKYYDFCVDTYRVQDGIYGDYIGLSKEYDDSRYHGNGKPMLADHPYTYHQGSMIEAGVRLYRATGEEKYLDDARMTAEACIERDMLGTFIDGVYQPPMREYHWFNLCFLRGFMLLAEEDEKYDEQVQLFQTSIDYAYEHYYQDGLLPSNFVHGWIADYEYDTRINVMDVSAYAQYYFMLSLYQSGKAMN